MELKKKEEVSRVLVKHKDGVFEWSGRYGLFVNHVVSIPTEGEPVYVQAFRMTKAKRDVAEEIIEEYLERNIVEASDSKWNALAFLVRKQCKEEETRAYKRWRMVEDYWQLNKVIKDDTFEPPSVSEIIKDIGRENKYYYYVNLRQGYHHLPLKVEDRKKTTFSTGGLTGRLQYRLLPYGLKHG
jgi:hypothetical protein